MRASPRAKARTDHASAVTVRTKRLYATRSNIVHGRGMSKADQTRLRKRQKRKELSLPTEFSLYLHPLAHVVPLTELRELTELCVRLLRTALGDDELRSLLQGRR
jgi:hypothetical protein